MVLPIVSPSARIERATHREPAPGAYDRGQPCEYVRTLAYERAEARIADVARVILGHDRRQIACRGDVLRLKRPRRVRPEVPVHRSGSFCVNETIQNLYSIDCLPELPGRQRRSSPHPGHVVGDLIALKFGQPPTPKGPDDLLRQKHMPAHRYALNPLREKNVPVAVRETPFPGAATSSRHKPTSMSVRNEVRGYAAATGGAGAGREECYTESVYHRYRRFW